MPADIEAHAAGHRRGTAVEHRVEEIVEVVDAEVVYVKARLPGGEIGFDRGRRYCDRREQTRWRDTRLPVVQLVCGVANGAPVIQVNSDEAERAVPQFAAERAVNA